MSIGESTVRISRLQRKVIKSCEGLLGDTTKFPDNEAPGLRKTSVFKALRDSITQFLVVLHLFYT